MKYIIIWNLAVFSAFGIMNANDNNIGRINSLKEVSPKFSMVSTYRVSTIFYSNDTKNVYYYTHSSVGSGWALQYLGPNLENADLTFGPLIHPSGEIDIVNHKIFVLWPPDTTASGRFFIGDDVDNPKASSFLKVNMPYKITKFIISPDRTKDNVADLYIYSDLNKGVIKEYYINCLTKEFISGEKTYNLTDTDSTVSAFSYNPIAKTVNFIETNSNNSYAKLGEIKNGIKTAWDANNFIGCNKLFSFEDYYYGMFTYKDKNGIAFERANAPQIDHNIFENLGIITSVNIFDNRLIIGTKNNGLWYSSYQKPSYANRYNSIWKLASDKGNKFSDKDSVYSIADNSYLSSRLNMSILNFADMPNEYSTLYTSVWYFFEYIKILIILGSIMLLILLITIGIISRIIYNKRTRRREIKY